MKRAAISTLVTLAGTIPAYSHPGHDHSAPGAHFYHIVPSTIVASAVFMVLATVMLSLRRPKQPARMRKHPHR